jgi:hypothetical protein
MNEKFYNCVKKWHATALFLTLLDRFKNHIFYERKRMKKLALFLTDIKKRCFWKLSNYLCIIPHVPEINKFIFTPNEICYFRRSCKLLGLLLLQMINLIKWSGNNGSKCCSMWKKVIHENVCTYLTRMSWSLTITISYKWQQQRLDVWHISIKRQRLK